MGASDELAALVAELNSSAEPEMELISWIGVGELENLIRAHGVELWPQVEQLARTDLRFREALNCVWAYDSPEFERRTALLEELGVFSTETVEFVAERDGFGGTGDLGWRAFEHKGRLSDPDLAALLRQLADWLERPT